MKCRRALLSMLVLASACADPAPPAADLAGSGAAPPGDVGLKRLDATRDHRWIYDGLLPALDDWRAYVSLSGHTVRLEGLLPDGYEAPLPYWAFPEQRLDGRVKLTVVYPIATARLVDERGAPTGNRNASPGDYPSVGGWPYTPSDATTGIPWGGFPYLEYDSRRSLAFHGPITSENGGWKLQRGPVSHGCARMQGEHVVELAALMGLDMASPSAQARGLAAPTGDFRVRVLADFDRLADGRVVDVDHPATGFSRPVGDSVVVFPTWDAGAFPRFTCAHDPDRAVGEGHCDALTDPGRNPLRPADLGRIECPEGYSALPVGAEGGRLCTDGKNAWGPFPRAMVEQCKAWGGGLTCDSERWSLELARSARGSGVCPRGASLDARDTAYCMEGQDAFGPFPRAAVLECERRGGGRACRSARWSARLLRAVTARVGRLTEGDAMGVTP